ncbi:Uncharacterised protein [Leminorella richardii]|uniref:Uncharacterized protein n=1 Tax=Leminorella richardii TaxID=158841 RepID=A0A2X4XBA3_9GAMM|nr:hypothetical protein [Leminorella richardii]SQI33844.1 Uncharacterised protein [Leminorella richardii]
MDDFSLLLDTEHMFKWLANEPFPTIRSDIESLLCQSVVGSRLLSFQATSKPQWLTGGRRESEDAKQVILVRSGVAFEFMLSVQSPTGDVFDLQGVYSRCGYYLDEPEKRKYRCWLDIDGDLTTLGEEGELMSRLYEVEKE